MGYWIIDSLDSFKNVDSFSNETPLCCSETQNSSAVALIETSLANLSKNSQYCITNCELCVCFTHNEELPHRRHVYMRMWAKCAVKTDRLGGSEVCSIWSRSSVCMTSKYRESDSNFESMQSHLLSVALVVLWCHTAIGLRAAASSRTERKGLWSNTLYELAISLSLSLPRPPPPPKKKLFGSRRFT